MFKGGSQQMHGVPTLNKTRTTSLSSTSGCNRQGHHSRNKTYRNAAHARNSLGTCRVAWQQDIGAQSFLSQPSRGWLPKSPGVSNDRSVAVSMAVSWSNPCTPAWRNSCSHPMNQAAPAPVSRRNTTSINKVSHGRGCCKPQRPAEVFLSNFFRLLYCLNGSYLVLPHTVRSTIKSMYWTSGLPRFPVLNHGHLSLQEMVEDLICRPRDTWKEVILYLLLEMVRCVSLTPEEWRRSTVCSWQASETQQVPQQFCQWTKLHGSWPSFWIIELCHRNNLDRLLCCLEVHCSDGIVLDVGTHCHIDEPVDVLALWDLNGSLYFPNQRYLSLKLQTNVRNLLQSLAPSAEKCIFDTFSSRSFGKRWTLFCGPEASKFRPWTMSGCSTPVFESTTSAGTADTSDDSNTFGSKCSRVVRWRCEVWFVYVATQESPPHCRWTESEAPPLATARNDVVPVSVVKQKCPSRCRKLNLRHLHGENNAMVPVTVDKQECPPHCRWTEIWGNLHWRETPWYL